MEPVTVSVVVMAHPKRMHWARSLADELDCQIVWDEVNTVWETGRRALLAFDPKATHHLVIQDDTILRPDILALVAEAAKHTPDRPVGMYLGRKDPDNRVDPWIALGIKANRASGAGFLAHSGPIWGPAVMNPVEHIPAIVAHGDNLRSPAYDRKIMDYWRLQHVECYYTTPSLVTHRPVSENPSLVDPKRTGNRYAVWFDTETVPDFSQVQATDSESLWPTVTVTDPRTQRSKRVRRGSVQWERLTAKGWT